MYRSGDFEHHFQLSTEDISPLFVVWCSIRTSTNASYIRTITISINQSTNGYSPFSQSSLANKTLIKSWFTTSVAGGISSHVVDLQGPQMKWFKGHNFRHMPSSFSKYSGQTHQIFTLNCRQDPRIIQHHPEFPSLQTSNHIYSSF